VIDVGLQDAFRRSFLGSAAGQDPLVRMEWTEAARAARRRACDDAVEPAASARFAAWLQDVLTRERGERCGMLSTVHFLRESDGGRSRAMSGSITASGF
jgi:hypothetical protein